MNKPGSDNPRSGYAGTLLSPHRRGTSGRGRRSAASRRGRRSHHRAASQPRQSRRVGKCTYFRARSLRCRRRMLGGSPIMLWRWRHMLGRFMAIVCAGSLTVSRGRGNFGRSFSLLSPFGRRIAVPSTREPLTTAIARGLKRHRAQVEPVQRQAGTITADHAAGLGHHGRPDQAAHCGKPRRRRPRCLGSSPGRIFSLDRVDGQ